MRAEKLTELIGADFYTGVPDSLLNPLCSYLMSLYGTDPRHHMIAANEGNAVALAAGYYLATGKVPVIYLQNSGEGNILNPAVSLLHEKVYAIPALFIIGWRGEPGVHDEPQHIFQGEITRSLLDLLEIPSFIMDAHTSDEQIAEILETFRELFRMGKDAALIVRKGAISCDKIYTCQNHYTLSREECIRHITQASGTDPVISTTGKASRELFEIRNAHRQGHQYDFLTVGSMGHSSSIALGIALQKPGTRVWCVDGDGAALMHMGALAVTAAAAPDNLIHIVINNGAHESVGGLPTAAAGMDIAAAAKACGYPYTVTVDNARELDFELEKAKKRGTLSLIEVKCAVGARDDLGRPDTSAAENKRMFMEYLEALDQ